MSRLNTPAGVGGASRFFKVRQGTPYSRTPTSKASQSSVASSNLKIVRAADPIGVYCRVRPWGTSDEDRCVKILDDKQIVLTPPESSGAWKLGVANENTYSFQQVFGPDVDQQTIQETVALPFVEDVLRGKNALLFAYGVTGSGKTYTMSGNGVESGIMPRTFDVIFNSIGNHQARKYTFKPDRMNGFDVQSNADAMLDRQKEIQAVTKTPRTRNGQARFVQATAMANNNNNNAEGARIKDNTVLPVAQEDHVYAVFVTYIEIYNNFVYDLLDETMIDDRTKKFNLQPKMLREDGNHNVYVNGVTEIEVLTSEEAFEVFQRGQRKRKQAHTCLNTESSRSHAIFNIRIVQSPLDANGEEVIEADKIAPCISQLSLVDLAGSERYGRTGATGERLKEAGNINNSLMTLRKCMNILRENQQTGSNIKVPYRDSKLTHYLKNYFEGEGRVRMIICLNPRNDDYDESIHVMTFAELTREVQVTRPQEKERKPDPLLTPGRRKANEIFKEARRRIVEDINISEDEIPIDVNMVFGLGPPLPHCQMTKSDEEDLILNLRKALELRIKGRAELAKVLNEKRHNFRIRLIDVERDMETLKVENATLKYRIDQVVADKESTENVLRSIREEKTEQELRADELEKENRLLKEKLETCQMELRQREMLHLKDKEHLKSDLDIQRELNELKSNRELMRKEAKLKATYKSKEKTLEAVRQLVQSSDASARHSRRRSRSESLSTTTTSSESDIPATYSKTPITTRSRVISAPHLLTDRSPQKSCSGGIAISNPRHNRARSTDRDTWLEHTPGQAIRSGTVMQPVMKKKKSVNQLTSADDVVNKAKYCLNLQDTDGEGGVETRLYKGDVLPSRSGGAQVVFNDVEILKQVSPTDVSPRKRPSSSALTGTPLRGGLLGTYDELDENGLTLAERCSTGIGYQHPNGSSKRSRQH